MVKNEDMCNDSNVSDIYYSDNCKDYDKSLESNDINLTYSDSSEESHSIYSLDGSNSISDDDGITDRQKNKDKPEILSDNLENECSICFEPMKSNEYSILEKCTHHFHEVCIKEWFDKINKPSCPICGLDSKSRIGLEGDDYQIISFNCKQKCEYHTRNVENIIQHSSIFTTVGNNSITDNAITTTTNLNRKPGISRNRCKRKKKQDSCMIC